MEGTDVVKELASVKCELAELKERLLFKPGERRYSYEDVATLADVTTRTVRAHEKHGFIKAKYPRAKHRFTEQDVDRYLRGGR